MNETVPSDSAAPTPIAADRKIVIVMSSTLPRGASDNRAAVLATGLAFKHPEIIGPPPVTADGVEISAFTSMPIVVLSTPSDCSLVELSQRATTAGCTCLIFLQRAQGMRSYEAYRESISSSRFDTLDIDAALFLGEKRIINKLTGSFPSFR